MTRSALQVWKPCSELWPVEMARYDCSPSLTNLEREALNCLVAQLEWKKRTEISGELQTGLTRLLQPLHDIQEQLGMYQKYCTSEGSNEISICSLLPSHTVTLVAKAHPVTQAGFPCGCIAPQYQVGVDTDTSTSDTVAIMANGLAGDVDLAAFQLALQTMAIELAKELARDGEGATKLLEVTVDGAASFAQAKRVAKSIVNSPLVKTAIFGADPNWGRVAMAIGKCEEQVDIVPEKVSIAFGDLPVYQGHPFPEDQLDLLTAYLRNSEVVIRVSLGLGNDSATVWGCDLTHGYIDINAAYST